MKKQKFTDFYEAWWFLEEHPLFRNPEFLKNFPKNIHKFFGTFQQCLCIEVQLVNPKTDMIEDDMSLNTKTVVWLECGGYLFVKETQKYEKCHDIKLDCGGNTFEEAIIKLANLVYKHYKNKGYNDSL